MPRKDRLEVIKSIEEYRKSRVLVYFLGDRPNLFTVIADDSVSVINEHLRKMGKMETLDVFLYTRGGIGMAPARIVSLIREYSKNLDILVPYRCLSGGTVMCCGANNIIMTAMAELSPVDASTSGPFNPQDRLGRNIQISVEDVRAYLELAASAGLKSEGMTLEVFKLLSGQVNVIALGNVQRVYNTGISVIPSLLGRHMNEITEKDRIEGIVKALSGKYTHDYLITRREAKAIGLPIMEPDERLEELIWNLYQVYERDLQLRIPFIADLPLDQNSLDFRHETAYVESKDRTDAFVMEGTISRSPPQPQPPQIQIGLPGVQPPVVPGLPQIPGLPVVRFKSQTWVNITETSPKPELSQEGIH